MVKKAKNKKSPKTPNPPPQIWCITDFDDIFKMADDVRKGRKGPLAYTKSFVSLSGASKACETHHYERLKDLKSRPERHLLRSVFEDLKNWAAHKPQNYQGYLVTHSGGPADYDYIAAQIDHVDKKELKKAMMILSKIGLIERISLNGQFSAEKAEQPDDSGNETTDSGNDVDSFRKAEDKSQAAPEEDVSEDKAPINKTADGSKENLNGNSTETKANVEGKGKQQDKEPLPTEPSNSEVLGGDPVKAGCKPPHNSVNQTSKQQRAGPTHSEGDYEKCDLYYGQRIYEALGYKRAFDSNNAIRETTSFASKFHECRCRLHGLPPPEIDKLGIRGLAEAKKIARRCEQKKQKKLINELGLKLNSNNRAAIWNALMTKISLAMQKGGVRDD